MVQPATSVTSILADLLRGEKGIDANAAALQMTPQLPLIGSGSIVELQAAPDVAEKASGGVKYPMIHVYCDRITNTLKQKFRRFSGTANLNIEIRVSHDRLTELQTQLKAYVEAVTGVLETSRGAWDANTWYPGQYEVTFSTVKHGGRNYLQTARVQLQVDIQVE